MRKLPGSLAGTSGRSDPPDSVRGLLARVLELAEEAEWAQLATLLPQALGEHPGEPYVLCWLGTAERELGMEAVAYERFKQVLELSPRDPAVLATAGSAVAAFDDPTAEGALRTAALLGPDLAHARLMYGSYLAREGMIEEGLRELDLAAELAPDDPLVHMEFGVALTFAGDLEAAEVSFGRATELDPEDGWAWILGGLAHMELGNPNEVATALEHRARLRPDDVVGQLLAALALTAVGSAERGLEMLERARTHAGPVDAGVVSEVEDRIHEGPEDARELLTEALGPSSFRERLRERP